MAIFPSNHSRRTTRCGADEEIPGKVHPRKKALNAINLPPKPSAASDASSFADSAALDPLECPRLRPSSCHPRCGTPPRPRCLRGCGRRLRPGANVPPPRSNSVRWLPQRNAGQSGEEVLQSDRFSRQIAAGVRRV